MAFIKLMAERLSETVVNQLIAEELKRILDAVAPQQVYLFGSASRGEMTDASDLDFLITVRDGQSLREIKQRYYRCAGERVIPVDAVFVTENQFSSRSQIGGVCMICQQEGKLLFDARKGDS